MTSAVATLLSILDLETLEKNLFRGRSPQDGWQRVFGGQVIGQSLVAASRTVDSDKLAHSLHCYFMRPGDPKVPIIYEVDTLRDGRSFVTRQVKAIQHGKAIFTMSASFHKQEEGLNHQMEMPDIPAPEDLPSEADTIEAYMAKAPDNIKAYFRRERPIELRPVNMEHYTTDKKHDPLQYVWVRTTSTLPDDPAIHKCALAYASDMTLLDTSLFAHGRSVFNKDVSAASLDHAMWFHADFRADEWLLYSQDSPWAGGARGINRGSLFRRDGTLVATAVQEGLIRISNR
ncbi:acyl-CoA thioesterase II [Cohaesibacter celericrescens]|uniref:Acyl-CoA thioesterase 2 n=1 Tax=Cohaesibacter celericrescens TaxID=2067669 RepID=A0A2N5XPA0_9HYPH|nr:acyl-CoA thioesterase II [Cohaesibacter celericrescens]PLW76305.1 acyl-CoA thioesterase II [Cohaesibacter celericrescens]